MTKKKSSTKAAANRRSTSVPGSYRGFSLQATRFLYYLLTMEPNDIVSLEYFEDVGIEKPDGSKLAEQDKSYLSSNPLTDRSVVFWKTLRNWVDAATLRTLPADNSRFFAYAPNARMGEIVEAFHNATTLKEAKFALRGARKALTGKGGWDINDAAVEHVEVVFKSDEDLVAQMITRFTVDVATESPEGALKRVLLGKLVGEDSFDQVITWAHGWVKREIDLFVGRGEPPRVLQKTFHEALLNYVRRHDRINILRSVAGTPSDEKVAEELAERDYVTQLRIIDVEDDGDLLQAVNDFLSASVDRTAWSDRGMISEKSLETLASELTVTWRNKRRGTSIAHADKDEKDQGKILYSDCMEHDARVDDLETPRQFIRGSWHALAEDQNVGWHPEYKSELAAIKSAASKETAEAR